MASATAGIQPQNLRVVIDENEMEDVPNPLQNLVRELPPLPPTPRGDVKPLDLTLSSSPSPIAHRVSFGMDLSRSPQIIKYIVITPPPIVEVVNGLKRKFFSE